MTLKSRLFNNRLNELNKTILKTIFIIRRDDISNLK